VTIFRLPHNYRDPLYNVGEAPSTFCDDTRDEREPPQGTEFTTLPIPMPKCVIAVAGRDDVIIAATADGKRVPWQHIDTVMLAVMQFNEDCARLGIVHPPMQELEPPEEWHDGEPPVSPPEP
jgi:hypothetical protein